VARLYEKFSTFLRLEICVNRLKDLGLNKGLENLGALREKLVVVSDRLAGLEAELLNAQLIFLSFNDWLSRSPPARAKYPVLRSRTPA